jgi:HEAT repeat protein
VRNRYLDKAVTGTNIFKIALPLLVILSSFHFSCEKYVKDEPRPTGLKKGYTKDNLKDTVDSLLNTRNAATDTQALIESLKDEDWHERYIASRAMGWLNWKPERASSPLPEDTQVVEALIEALKDEDHRVRHNICWAFAKIKDERATGPLIEVLKNDEDSEVRSEAAWALG